LTIARLLIAGAAASAMLHIQAEYRGPRWLVYVTKPLTTTLLVVLAAIAPHADPRYQFPIVAGLVFSLAGDVFLMLPKDRFIAGLISFLIAHIAYIVAFTAGVPFGDRPVLLLPFLALAAIVLFFLWPRLGKLRIPVLVYVAALVTMAWQASIRAAHLPGSIGAAIGALLFVISDGVLAINRFRVKFRLAQAIVMTTYVIAQMLIALSV